MPLPRRLVMEGRINSEVQRCSVGRRKQADPDAEGVP